MKTLAEIIAAKKKESREAKAPLGSPSEPRQLSESKKGERVPMEFPTGDQKEDDWLDVKQAFSTEVGIVIDPGENPEHAWIALQRTEDPGNVILLHPLPLFGPKKTNEPF